ncbi:NB-ARC domain disease resistance protein [Medicago truncatula]|uniref:NB-ARC domain disease resistance protein n=1 Tax=Medicago truncatula TaxID=3880 RepID=G7L7A5_MEDTR|nr:NB-ARC domain disease resistance protein [Medicago truncatula]
MFSTWIKVKEQIMDAVRVRYQLFQKTVTATVTKKPDINKIQTQIGDAIGLNFNDMTEAAKSTCCMCFGNSKRMTTADRAHLICAKMKELQTVLVVLYDLHGRFDLGEIGVPFGEDHNGCKVLLTPKSVECKIMCMFGSTSRGSRVDSGSVELIMTCLLAGNLNILGDALLIFIQIHWNTGENLIGLCGLDKRVKAYMKTVIRRAERDQLFQKIVTTTVTKMSNTNRGCNRLTTTERALLLCAKMKELQTVLVVVYDLYGRLDLSKIGIPFGEDHNGCKILLTSTTTSLEILSKQMKVHNLIQLDMT